MRAKSLAVTALTVALVAGLTSWPSPAWAEGPTPSPTPSESHRADPVGVFLTRGDKVHFSSTPPPTISAHGWWLDPSAGDLRAKVTVELQVKQRNGDWRTVATGSKTVRQGGGSARRANVRKSCVGTATTTWRSRVDVDIIGVADSPGKLLTAAYDYGCGVG